MVIQGQYDLGVTYTSTQICAFKGSTVNISCSYTYQSRINDLVTKVEKRFWFTELGNGETVDLTTVSEYSGRVQYHSENKDCTLRISDLRERDSAEYKFRFTTNQGGKYIGSPGVTAGLQVQVSESPNQADLKCQSSCPLPGRPSYIWYKNGQNIQGQTSDYYSASFDPADIFSCAVRGHEDFPSPSVYGPKLPSVSVSPSAEIVEGSLVNLTCSSDANPAANYTWYKENEDSPKASGQIFTITDFRAEHSGNYYCVAQNRRGSQNSTLHLIVVAGNLTMIMNIIRLTVVVLMLIPLLLLSLWARQKKTLSSTTGPHEHVEIETLVLTMRTSQTLQHRQKTQRSRKTWCEVQSDAAEPEAGLT
ncbi:B-cell receptor CD22-like [Perca flavescens]|uniref:B-cell receptor CD22-like n=1 Tax=Perca flavescens TaxID=8167 RepID=UPI00106EE119|nr:B-cell receptor CD22-like [Perca flavescens]